MTEGSKSGKTAEERVEEAKKWHAEAERSFAVVKAKEAHRLIEETEKSRKRSAVFSVIERLLAHARWTNDQAMHLLRTRMKSRDPNNELTRPEKMGIEDLFKTYESIRYDLQKTLEIRDEDMGKLFPKINIDFSDVFTNNSKLLSMINQMHHMVYYCLRMT